MICSKLIASGIRRKTVSVDAVHKHPFPVVYSGSGQLEFEFKPV